MNIKSDLVGEILRFSEEHDLYGLLEWYFSVNVENNIKFYINCNDIMHWGCSDNEEIDNISFPLLKETFKEIESFSVMDTEYELNLCDISIMLFVCRMRKMRPQNACYPLYRNKGLQWKIHELLNACGPEREVDILNPL